MSEVKWEDLGYRILYSCRNELYSYFPYLDGAFASVRYKAGKDYSIATDGEVFYFSPVFLMKQYRDNPVFVRRGYLHMLLHCLYLHLFRDEGCKKRLWDIACDMAVELVIDDAAVQALQLPSDTVRAVCLRKLSGRSWSVQQLYRMLEAGGLPYSIEEVEKAFAFDEHCLWEADGNPVRQARTRRKWEKILAYTGQNKNDRKRKAGRKRGSEEESLEVSQRGRFDYRKFLRRFAVPREEVEMDMESFDYVYYNYGM